MEKDKVPAPPREGIVYGEIAYWLLLVGVLVAVVGFIIYMASSEGFTDKALLLDYLWQGHDCQTIWQEASGVSQSPEWYSGFGALHQGDMLAMLGIAVSCLAAVFGIWGVFFQTIRSRVKLYLIFALVIAIILTLSASGLITMGD